MDMRSRSQVHQAERLSRQAAANAHAAYYAHPSLHLHTYLPSHDKTGQDRPQPDSEQDGAVVQALNGPAVSAPSATTHDLTQSIGKAGTEGTREEEGGRPNAGLPSGEDRGAMEPNGEAGGTHSSPGPSAQEVAKYKENVQAVANGEAGAGKDIVHTQTMSPHLQMMCGPLLSYYTTTNNHWQGGIMVVTKDSGSVYEPAPSVTFSFHKYTPPSDTEPTQWDASSELIPSITLSAVKFFEYDGGQGLSSFWRFIVEIPLQQQEMTVRYSINGGASLAFVVPAIGQNFHWSAHSCNGFSSGVNPDEFKGEYQSGYDPVWEDMLLKHHARPFHCMVGGGDQIYCDAITREPELQGWINAPDRDSKITYPLSDEMRVAIDRFYFNHYCKIFRSNAFGRANATIPMVNMLDDHDLIDGFGTYDDETQQAPVFSHIGSRGYFWFLIFQLFINDAHDGVDPTPGTHVIKSLLLGAKRGPWIPFSSHSLIVYLGPKVSLLAIDCRAERKLHQICTRETYERCFNAVRQHKGIEQLVILLGVPIAYPRMSFLEHFLGLKWNPLNVLARHNAMGLGGMVNKFNQSSELLDDLNDHWCANVHKEERNWLVLQCQDFAQEMNARISFLSGDVHLAACGVLFTKTRKGRSKIEPAKDFRYMLNVVSSAIVNTPPPAGAARMVGMLGSHKHRTLQSVTDESMLPLFAKDTDGGPMKSPLVQARRNYTSVDFIPETSELIFDFRVEKSQGAGETVSYPVTAPAPRWSTA